MNHKVKNILTLCLVGILFFGFALWSLLKPRDPFSDSERRVLRSFPEFNAQTLFSGKFTKDFESYAQDQFPLRDSFRSLKAMNSLYILHQLDNNRLYSAENHLSRMEYPLHEEMLSHAAEHINNICETYLKENKVYLCIVPDKNYYLAEKNGRLALDYRDLTSFMQSRVNAQPIDLFPLLSEDDYYRTDTHWRQECILDAAHRLAAEMGVTLNAEYREITLNTPFYGVFYGQAALPVAPDSITYLDHELFENCIVTVYDSGEAVPAGIYDFSKLSGKDPYEFFLSGAVALMTIENPSAETEKELILFRDSFAGSLAPLLAEGYSKITLADTRYLPSDSLGEYIDFEDQDVLFLYSTVLLNNSLALK